jgi:hypothetical protein
LFFPPVTALTSLFYVGGDGQEATPNPTQPAATLLTLPRELQVGVANGDSPVGGATVQFALIPGEGNGQRFHDKRFQLWTPLIPSPFFVGFGPHREKTGGFRLGNHVLVHLRESLGICPQTRFVMAIGGD